LAAEACAKPVPPQGIVYEQDVQYGRTGDVSLHLDLARPEKANGSLPAIVVIHGGAWRAGHRSQHTDIIFQLAQRGYVAATISYRFCPRHRFPAQVEDAKCAVRFLRAHAEKYQIDKDRVGAIGASAGAHLAMMLGTMGKEDGLEGDGGWPDQSSQVQAVVAFFGPTNLLADDMPAPTVPLLRDFIGGNKNEKREIYLRASPIRYVSPGDAPLLMLQGTKDPLVPHTQAVAMAEALSKQGVPGRVELYIGAAHGWGGKDLQHSLHQAYAFFDSHLRK
jgi:acetyl esterase/lipase